MTEKEYERDFIKTCFNVVAGLEVKNESQAIAKEAILDEVENLQKRIDDAIELLKSCLLDAGLSPDGKMMKNLCWDWQEYNDLMNILNGDVDE